MWYILKNIFKFYINGWRWLNKSKLKNVISEESIGDVIDLVNKLMIIYCGILFINEIGLIY